MTEMQETPPMSGNNLPVKELKTEKKPETKKVKKEKKRIYFIFILLIILFFTIGIGLGFYLKQKNDKELLPVPSPLPLVEPSPLASPSPSPIPEGIEGKIVEFERKLKEADLKEEDLSPPILDFDIRFEVED